MITRNFKLFLNSGEELSPVIHVNQHDSGEQWVFTVYDENGSQYVPSSGAIVGIKSDKKGILNTGSVDAQGRVIINETAQMTAAAGEAEFELLMDSATHGTANFKVWVEPRPGDNADLSESDLSLLQQAIDSTSAAAIAQGVADWMDDNLTPTTPVVDASLSVSGAAADSKKVGDEISDLKSQISNSMPYAVKVALDTILQNVAFKNDDGYSSELATFHTWATAVNLVSISAVYTQSGDVYDCDSLDSLRSDLVVTATYDDSTVAVITGYTLSGTLEEGTSTITVTYGGETATFTVTNVIHALFRLTEPFVSTGTEYVDTGVAFEANKQYSLECTFVITEFTLNTNGNGIIFGDTHGETSNYSALQENYVASGSNAGRYLWGCGFSWEDSKNFANVNNTIKFLITMDISSSGFERDWYISNVTAGTSTNGTQTRTTLDTIKGYNIFLGKQETSNGKAGFIGTLSDFKIYDRILTSSEISAYLNG